jgi:UDP-2,3-diacylglucosamine pyrophosphatase LpxH
MNLVSKLKFVLSDLHLGAGGGNPLEDFTADEQLVHFLQELTRESERDRREIELIINGDFLEFLQVPAVDNFEPATIYPQEAFLDSSQKASVKRLDLIANGHRDVFAALSKFMQADTPKRRITIIKGNHDVNLYWPLVKSRLRDVLDASGPRSSLLLFAAEFISREKIYVEHGHQRTEKLNRYPDFHDPRLPDKLLQLYYPPGSQLLIEFLNEVEREQWFVDKVKPSTALIWFALPWDFDFAANMLARLIRLTAGEPARAGMSPAFGDLLPRLENPDERRQMSRHYANDPAFREQFHQQIQPYLAVTSMINSTSKTSPQTEFQSDPIAMGRAEQEQQQVALQHAAAEISQQEKAEIILFGHSHQPDYRQLDTGGTYINTGCWLGEYALSEAQPELLELLFRDSTNRADFPIRLPYARIDYDEDDSPTAQLLDFANNGAVLQGPAQKSTGFFTKLLGRLTSSQ